VTNQDDYEQVGDGVTYGSPSPQPFPSPSHVISIGNNIAVAPPEDYDRAGGERAWAIVPMGRCWPSLGWISLTKGLDTLLDALARLPAQFRLLRDRRCSHGTRGSRYADAIRRQIARLGLDQRVTITATVPRRMYRRTCCPPTSPRTLRRWRIVPAAAACWRRWRTGWRW
jgi:hypothetical protein